jgi:hypothetical protein
MQVSLSPNSTFAQRKGTCTSVGRAAFILNLVTRCKWSASRSGCFTVTDRGIWAQIWSGNIGKEIKLLPLPEIEPLFFRHNGRVPITMYRLVYTSNEVK